MDNVLDALRSLLDPVYLEYAIEIFIIYLLLYTFLRFMEGTRGEGILKGIALAILTVPVVVAITADQFEVLDRLLVITKFLGFTPWNGEGKVMGLAAYGTPAYRDAIERLCPANADGSSRLNLEYFRHHLGLPWIGPKLVELLGAPREPDAPLEQRHSDLAASLQLVFEERLLSLARRLKEKSGETRLACAGGVFLNGVANWRIRQEAGFVP